MLVLVLRIGTIMFGTRIGTLGVGSLVRIFIKYLKESLYEKLKMFLASWRGHLRSADSWNLVKFINKENELWKIRTQLASH